MNRLMHLTFVVFLAVMAFGVTGCASKSNLQRDVASLQSQMAVVADELARLDQGLQDTKAGQGGASGVASRSAASRGPVYRTPSGFELPSISIQQALKNAGYYRGTVDGKIGSATQEAIRAFQKDNGLESDGVVGRTTWDRLKVYLGGAIK